MKYKNNVKGVVIGSILCAVQLTWGMHYPERSEDYIIVDSIQKESDISRADVDRWKLLWMGRLAEPVSIGVGAYGMMQAGTLLSDAHEHVFNTSSRNEHIKNVFKAISWPQWLRTPESITDVVTHQTVWAGVGVAGAGFAAYKLLYPRITKGIMYKIKRYITLCDNLTVTTGLYGSLDDLKQAAGDAGQTVWYVGDAIAVNNGLHYLKEQGQWALLLLDQIGGSAIMRSAILSAGRYLTHNINAIQNDVRQSIQQRIDQETGRINRQSEQLKVEKTQLDITSQKIKNVTSMWKTLQDTADFAIKHKEVIGATAAGAMMYYQGNKWLQ